MRLDNLKTFCRTQYGTSTERFDKEITAYRFENARVDVDEETVKAIKDACQIPQATAIASTQSLPDPRVDQLITGFQQLVPFVKAQNEIIRELVPLTKTQDQTIKRLEAEMVLLKTTAGEVTETLIREMEQLKETAVPTVAVSTVAVPAVPTVAVPTVAVPTVAVPAQFAGFESVFG